MTSPTSLSFVRKYSSIGKEIVTSSTLMGEETLTKPSLGGFRTCGLSSLMLGFSFTLPTRFRAPGFACDEFVSYSLGSAVLTFLAI